MHRKIKLIMGNIYFLLHELHACGVDHLHHLACGVHHLHYLPLQLIVLGSKHGKVDTLPHLTKIFIPSLDTELQFRLRLFVVSRSSYAALYLFQRIKGNFGFLLGISGFLQYAYMSKCYLQSI